MKALSDEYYLDSENFWKHRFTVKFVKVNGDGTEWWQVYHQKKSVNCNSMLSAFKIAHTAQEILEGFELSIDHTIVIRKAKILTGGFCL